MVANLLLVMQHNLCHAFGREREGREEVIVRREDEAESTQLQGQTHLSLLFSSLSLSLPFYFIIRCRIQVQQDQPKGLFFSENIDRKAIEKGRKEGKKPEQEPGSNGLNEEDAFIPQEETGGGKKSEGLVRKVSRGCEKWSKQDIFLEGTPL